MPRQSPPRAHRHGAKKYHVQSGTAFKRSIPPYLAHTHGQSPVFVGVFARNRPTRMLPLFQPLDETGCATARLITDEKYFRPQDRRSVQYSISEIALGHHRCDTCIEDRCLGIDRPTHAFNDFLFGTPHPMAEAGLCVGLVHPTTSVRTISAPATMAFSFPNAIARGRYFMPQSGATIRRSASMCFSAPRMRSATVSGASTAGSPRSRTP